MKSQINFKGIAYLEHWRRGKLIGIQPVNFNGVKDTAINDILGVYFDAVSQSANWYMGVINNSGSPSEDPTDTLASHAGWTEFTDYSGNRPEWAPDAPSSKQITNSSVITFTFTGTGTIYGFSICNVATGDSGMLWATGALSTPESVISGDVFKFTYTVTGSDES